MFFKVQILLVIEDVQMKFGKFGCILFGLGGSSVAVVCLALVDRFSNCQYIVFDWSISKLWIVLRIKTERIISLSVYLEEEKVKVFDEVLQTQLFCSDKVQRCV